MYHFRLRESKKSSLKTDKICTYKWIMLISPHVSSQAIKTWWIQFYCWTNIISPILQLFNILVQVIMCYLKSHLLIFYKSTLQITLEINVKWINQFIWGGGGAPGKVHWKSFKDGKSSSLCFFSHCELNVLAHSLQQRSLNKCQICFFPNLMVST